MNTLFPRDYEQSRARFRQYLDRVRARWPDARLEHHRLAGDEVSAEDLTIDWIQAHALERQERLLLFTAGEHGLEAYVGARMLQLFVEEFLPHLEPQSTGLLLVHTINPWGMAHRRRTNGSNVDLNRNFVQDPRSLDSSVNAEYTRLMPLLNPEGPVRSLILSNLSFLFGLLGAMASLGPARFRQVVLLGQYRFPRGLYYGGDSLQEETKVLMELYRAYIPQYRQVVHLDMHTGYGPRHQMSIVGSCVEPRSSQELARLFSYPLVVKTTPDEFYSMQGDMIDYVYALARDKCPQVQLYAASFEFGTLGDSTPALLRSLRALVLENQVHRFGAKDQALRERVAREFQELFFPQDEGWRAKAVADARRAFRGILGAQGFLSQTGE